MGKSSPAAPAVPDYAAAAKAQGAANVETARTQGQINNPNIVGPLGGQTVTWGTPTFDQAGYDKAMASYQANPRGDAPIPGSFQSDDGFNNQGYQDAMNKYMLGMASPTKAQFTSLSNPDQATVTQTLTPAAQATLDAQQQVQKSLANLGQQGLGTASSVLGTAFNPNLPGIQTNIGNAGQIAQAPNLSQYGQAGANINAGPVAQGPDLSAYGMAGANVNAQGVNYGPQVGQYGMARGGPRA
jgi:hypothetical protein